MITFSHKGDFSDTFKFLNQASKKVKLNSLHKYGLAGVNALAAATPRDTGETARSWSYKVEMDKKGVATITWHNSNIEDGVSVAILLQYGHATNSGAYVKGIDYINPALKPIFDQMAEEMWKEFSK